MYPRKKQKTDEQRFYDAFKKKVGCAPEDYLRRKLAGGADEEELKRLYNMLALEIAMKAHCTAIRYDQLEGKTANAAAVHLKRASTSHVPVCPRCGAPMVLRTGQSGPRKGQRFWGCSSFPDCRFTKKMEQTNDEL